MTLDGLKWILNDLDGLKWPQNWEVDSWVTDMYSRLEGLIFPSISGMDGRTRDRKLQEEDDDNSDIAAYHYASAKIEEYSPWSFET